MIRHRRRLTQEQKDQMQARKDSICEEQNGKCYYCNLDFNMSGVYPHAAHRIIDSVTNINKYGYEILDNRLNFRVTCPCCNVKAVLNPEKSEGRELIAEIREAIENGAY